jgi:hypothetical protein
MAPLSGTRLVSAMCREIYGITMFYLVKRTIHGHPRAATGESLLNPPVLTTSPRRLAVGCGAIIRDARRHRERPSLVDGGRARSSEDRHDAFDHRTSLFPRRTSKKTLEMYVKDLNARGLRRGTLNDPRVRAAHLGV